jgi:hypothetical protein
VDHPPLEQDLSREQNTMAKKDQCISAGVLPIARDGLGNLYFLLGREGARFEFYGREWGHFGGKRNDVERASSGIDEASISKIIAVRECFEETCGLLDVRKMIDDEKHLVAHMKLFDCRKRARRHNPWCPQHVPVERVYHFKRKGPLSSHPHHQHLVPHKDTIVENAPSVSELHAGSHPGAEGHEIACRPSQSLQASAVSFETCDCGLPSFHGAYVVEVPYDLSLPIRFGALRSSLSHLSRECVETKRLEWLVYDDQQRRIKMSGGCARNWRCASLPIYQHTYRIGRNEGTVCDVSIVDRRHGSMIVLVTIKITIERGFKKCARRVLLPLMDEDSQNRYEAYLEQLRSTLDLMDMADSTILNSGCVDRSRDLFYIDPIFLEKTAVRWWSLKEVLEVQCRRSHARFRPVLSHLINETLHVLISVPRSMTMAHCPNIRTSRVERSLQTLEKQHQGQEETTVAVKDLNGVLLCRGGILQFCRKSATTLIH